MSEHRLIRLCRSNLDSVKSNHKMEERFHFDLTFFKRFLRVVRILFPQCRAVTVLLFFLLLCLLLLQQVVTYYVGLVPSKYYLVLGNKDLDGFTSHTLYALMLVCSIAFIYATQGYIADVFYVTTRKLLTRRLHKEYFEDVVYYKLNVLDDTLDNPDQRITQDVDKLCKTLASISAKLLISPFTICYYIYKTWASTGYIGPLCVVGFFIVSTVTNKFLMSPVVGLVYRQEKLEGDFRFKHMQMRTHAESAAFYRCGSLERSKADQKLDQLIKIQNRLVLKEYLLNFFIKLADYLGSILSYVILAIPIFTGVYDDLSPSELSALISKNAFVTIYLIYSFTSLIDMALSVTDLAGVTHRVGQMLETLGRCHGDQMLDVSYEGLSSPVYHGSSPGDPGHPVVAYKLKSVTYGPPTGGDNILVKGIMLGPEKGRGPNPMEIARLLQTTLSPVMYPPDLSVEITSGQNVLVTGDSGCGKSSLLRVLDGLWPTRKGYVERHVSHGPRGVMYLPQAPMLTEGSLRDQITFPLHDVTRIDVGDESILEYLRLSDLSSLCDRTGGLDAQVHWNWYDILSPGEMQRLSFIRLFYHRPPFAVLDEATSQVSLAMESTLYSQCRHLGITVISVGHRESLSRHHDRQIHISGGGAYTVTEIANQETDLTNQETCPTDLTNQKTGPTDLTNQENCPTNLTNQEPGLSDLSNQDAGSSDLTNHEAGSTELANQEPEGWGKGDEETSDLLQENIDMSHL